MRNWYTLTFSIFHTHEHQPFSIIRPFNVIKARWLFFSSFEWVFRVLWMGRISSWNSIKPWAVYSASSHRKPLPMAFFCVIHSFIFPFAIWISINWAQIWPIPVLTWSQWKMNIWLCVFMFGTRSVFWCECVMLLFDVLTSNDLQLQPHTHTHFDQI